MYAKLMSRLPLLPILAVFLGIAIPAVWILLSTIIQAGIQAGLPFDSDRIAVSADDKPKQPGGSKVNEDLMDLEEKHRDHVRKNGDDRGFESDNPALIASGKWVVVDAAAQSAGGALKSDLEKAGWKLAASALPFWEREY